MTSLLVPLSICNFKELSIEFFKVFVIIYPIELTIGHITRGNEMGLWFSIIYKLHRANPQPWLKLTPECKLSLVCCCGYCYAFWTPGTGIEKMERPESTKLPHEMQRILSVFLSICFSPLSQKHPHFNSGIQPLLTQLVGFREAHLLQFQGVPDGCKGNSIPTVTVVDSRIVMCLNNRPLLGTMGRIFSLVLIVDHQAPGCLLFLWTHVYNVPETNADNLKQTHRKRRESKRCETEL